MDLLHGNVRKLYLKYLAAAFGSALISSIYGIVDMAMVGQYQGPSGTAALAVVAPVWNIIYSLGLLTGIGGSVLLGSAKGRGEKREMNQYFTAAFLLSVVLGLLSWLAVLFFEEPMLRLFGAEETLLPYAKAYLYPVKFGVPVFLFTQMLAAFLRNDDDPALATWAVIAGGVFNVFGDYFCIFTLDMGIMGAGLATMMGAAISALVMCTHFLKKKNTLRLVRPDRIAIRLRNITVTGFPTFFSDVAMGILTMLFNRQIVSFLGTDALSVYGVIVNISTIVQCCAYSVGQASQPIFSTNFGAGKGRRIRQTLRYALVTCGVFGLLWTALFWAIPNGFIHLFMKPTEAVLAIAPAILRKYGLSFILLPFNIFATYYFQSLLKTRSSMAVSVLRGMVLSGVLILVLPYVAGADSVWFAMPITELLTAVLVFRWMRKFTKELPECDTIKAT